MGVVFGLQAAITGGGISFDGARMGPETTKKAAPRVGGGLCLDCFAQWLVLGLGAGMLTSGALLRDLGAVLGGAVS